jgi:hypothetical protein
MAVDKILVVGKHLEAQQLVRPFAEHVYAPTTQGIFSRRHKPSNRT